MLTTGGPEEIHLVAGADVAVGTTERAGRAAVAVLEYPSLQVVEQVVAEGRPSFPYVPGLLSFREIPLLAGAFERLRSRPDLLLVDGQGWAHPRRFGLASHLGLLLDLPTIGCAKSRLIGEFEPPARARGAVSPLRDGEEVIGAVVRTRENVRPLFISIGHRINLEEAVTWVLRLTKGFRLPEPTRLADRAASGRVESLKEEATWTN